MTEVGKYPSTLEFEAPFDDPDNDYEQSKPEVISMAWKLRKASKAMRLEYFGEDRYPTYEEDVNFAEAIQDGLRARQELDDYLSSRTLPRHATVAELEDRIQKGTEAEAALVTINAPFALQSVRASMDIFPKSSSQKEINELCRYLSTFCDIRSLRSPYASFDDRMQNALIGLTQAARKFKPQIQDGKKAKFIGFAKHYINRSIQRGMLDDETPGLIIPIHKGDEVGRTRRAAHNGEIDKSEHTNTRLLEIASWMEAIPLDDELMTLYSDEEKSSDWDEDLTLSVADTVYNHDERSVEDTVLAAQGRGKLDEVLATLSAEREADIIDRRFGLSSGEVQKLDDIANVYGVTRTRIAQIESKALKSLRHVSRSHILQGFHDFDGSFPYYGPSLPGRLFGTSNMTLTRHSGHLNPPSIAIPSDFEIQEEDDDWETPLRFTSEEVKGRQEQAYQHFLDAVCSLEPLDFIPLSLNGAYPEQAIRKAEVAGGVYLNASHIGKLWNEIGTELFHDMSGKIPGESIGLFLSGLLQDLLRQEDTVVLTISEELSGKLDRFACELSCGRVVINGDLGDFAGAGNSGVSQLIVNGSIRDYGFAGAEGFAAVTIAGDTGRHFAYSATPEGEVRVDGTIAQLDLSHDFKGEIVAGKVVHTSLGGVAIRSLTHLREPSEK